MANIQLINLGSAPGAGDGENLRSGGEKINGNFQNLNNQANGLDSRVEALETSGDSASFGSGLQVDAITKVVSVKAKVEGGIAVSADGVQISADLAQTINDKVGADDLLPIIKAIGENGQAIADLQSDAVRVSAVNFAIGTYALVSNESTSIVLDAGSIYSGVYFGVVAFYMDSAGATIPTLSVGGTLSGSWRVMGLSIKARSSNMRFAGLAKRVA